MIKIEADQTLLQFHFEHLPNFSDDEKEYTDGQKEDVVGEVAEVRVADDEGGGVVLRDDVEDAVFVGQRNEENDDKNLRR